jgi:hypothetical protein
MRARSQSRYKNWGNTLEALRSKKKSDRFERLEQIEGNENKQFHEQKNYFFDFHFF